MNKQASKGKRAAKENQQAAQTNEAKGAPVKDRTVDFAIAGFILIGLHVALVWFLNPGLDKYNILDRDWGFDHISYFSKPVVFIFYGLAALFCLPMLSKKLWPVLETISEKLVNGIGKMKYLLFVALSGASFFMFKMFCIKYDFLGDMRIRMVQTLAMEFKKNSYLTMYLLHKIHSSLSESMTFEDRTFFQMHSFISGALFVLVALLISDLLYKKPVQKIISFAFHISIASVLYFFGYVEIYGLPGFMVALYLYTSLLCIKDKVHFIFPLAVGVLLPAFHIIGIAFLPSILVVAYHKYPKVFPAFVKKWKPKRFIYLGLLGLPVGYMLAKAMGFGWNFMPVTPPKKWPDYMTIFSLRHIWEFANAQVLATGTGIFFLILVIQRMIKGRVETDRTFWFLFVATMISLTLVFIADPIRGSGDWDVFALPAIAVNLFVVYAVLRFSDFKVQSKAYQFALLAGVVFNLLNVFTWVAINHTDKSIDKIADMLNQDPGNYYYQRLPSTMQLAFMYGDNELHEEALEAFEKNYRENYNDPRSHLNYANQLMQRDRMDEAAAVLEGTLQMAPYYPLPYSTLVNIYQQQKDQNKTYQVISRFFDAYHQNPNAFLARMSKQEVLSYLQYLGQVESQNNPQRAGIIMQDVQQLQAAGGG